jgi:hypothetical protein
MQRRIHKEVELAMTDRVEAGEHAVDEADLVRILSSDETEGSTAVGRGCMTALALMFGYTTIRDFTWKDRLALDACTNCGRASHRNAGRSSRWESRRPSLRVGSGST